MEIWGCPSSKECRKSEPDLPKPNKATISVLFFTLLFLTNCGFQRVSNDRLNNFQVKDFLISGDTKIANRIKNNLMINIRKESPNLISLSLNIKKTKNISEKNSANQITKYSINLIADVVLINEVYDKIDKVRGMDVSIVTSTRNNNHAFELLKGFNLPFRK